MGHEGRRIATKGRLQLRRAGGYDRRLDEKIMRLLPSLASLALIAALSGCSKDDSPAASGCEERTKTGGVCPGVTEESISSAGIACTSTVAATPADFAGKAASATPGTCLVLQAGTYPAVKLPAGVSVIGAGASATTLAGVGTKGHGAGATLRGLAIGAGGVVVDGAGTLTLEQVHVTGASTYGVLADGTSLVVRKTTIDTTGSMGLYILNTTSGRTSLALDRVHVHHAMSVGVCVHGKVDVTLDHVQVDHSKPVDFIYGRGLEVAGGGTVDAKNVAVVDNADVGLLIDGSAATLVGVTASRNVRGVQLQAIASGGKLSDFEIVDNSALGLGIARGTKGLIVQGGLVASTAMVPIPVDIGGLKEVGDGLNWMDSDVQVAETVKIQSSGRAAVIIDSTSTGKFAGSLGGGDETKGLIVQGGLVASMPAGLTISTGVKTDVLTKDKAMPVAKSIEMTAP